MPRRTALVVVDMLNRYEHEDAEVLDESVRETVPTMARETLCAAAGGSSAG